MMNSSKTRPRNYVGLACTFHDPALAIVDSSGQLIFAEATERHLQAKRAFNCLSDRIPYARDIIRTYCDPLSDLVLARTWSQWSIGHHARIGGISRFMARVLPSQSQWAP